MLRKLCIAMFAASLAWSVHSAAMADLGDPVWQLHFENEAEIKAKGGDLAEGGIEFVEGVEGKAAYARDWDNCITFRNFKNKINPREGTISFWLGFDWYGDDMKKIDRKHLWPFKMMAVFGDEPRIQLRIREGRALDFYVGEEKDGVAVKFNLSGWEDGEWHHVAFTYVIRKSPENEMIGEAKLYIDGTLIDSSTPGKIQDIGVLADKALLLILVKGFGKGENRVNMAMDELSIYGRSLTGEEIKHLFSTLAGSATKRVSHESTAESTKKEVAKVTYDKSLKTSSVFITKEMVEKAKANAEKYAWAREIQEQIIDEAQPWMKFSDHELWNSMFGSTITRSWMVWSKGHCPACNGDVRRTWQFNVFKYPWKVRCPYCGEIFPKNDFFKFYCSGIDEHGVFDPARADRSLLFNVEHPDPKDPLHKFGIDDGEGFVQDNNRWRFIGAYLCHGQWLQFVLKGIKNLSFAYVFTGNPEYAHKAGILLDRVADLYPTFDHREQGLVYETQSPAYAGYVVYRVNACEDTRTMALAYDMIFEALERDQRLVDFLSKKAKQFKLTNAKTSFEDIKRNIETRILIDALNNEEKIRTNFPRTPICVAVIKTVLGWPQNRSDVRSLISDIVKTSTCVDGLTGEKGLTDYSAYAIKGIANFLGTYVLMDPAFMNELLEQNPQLHQTYRFHIDTWCLQKYYPLSGDTSYFAAKNDRYVGVDLQKPGKASSLYTYPTWPSMYTFLWRLYKRTGDTAFVKVLYHANDNSVKGLSYDLFVDNPELIQQEAGEIIEREGKELELGSVNKRQWHLAILRSGKRENRRAVWLDYDAGGGHSHYDGMNLGLFAKGLDLMPDFGYPPTQYGGWSSPQALWYKMTAAHNTVVVDGRNQGPHSGKTTLWVDGDHVQTIRASSPGMIKGKQFERTVAMVDISDSDFYVVDVFRVIGGTDHAKLMHSHFANMTTDGLSLKPTDDYGHRTLMRNFKVDTRPEPAWSVDWKINDLYHFLPSGTEVHLKYTDLTTDSHAYTAEAWVNRRGHAGADEIWIPRIMVRRQASQAPLASTFVGIIEPYERKSNITKIRRLQLETPDGKRYPDANVAVEIQLIEGHRDLFIAADTENALDLSPSISEDKVMLQKEWGLRLDGELCMVRRHADGNIMRMLVCRGSSVSIGEVTFKLKKDTQFIEVVFDHLRPHVVSGNPEDIQEILIKGKNILQP